LAVVGFLANTLVGRVVDRDESADIVTSFREITTFPKRASGLLASRTARDGQVDAALERTVGRVAVSLAEPDPLDSVLTVFQVVRYLKCPFAGITPSLASLAVAAVPVVWRGTAVGSITSDLVAFVAQHVLGSIESILRVGLINGNDRVANKAADVVVSPPCGRDFSTTFVGLHGIAHLLGRAAGLGTIAEMAQASAVTGTIFSRGRQVLLDSQTGSGRDEVSVSLY